MARPDRSLRNRLKAAAYRVLALVPGTLAHQVTVRAHDEAHRVVLSVLPAAGQEAAEAERFPGRYFSDLEAAIWGALASGPLPAKAIARCLARKNTPSFRAILANLRQRQVLAHTREHGYARATLPPSSQASA